MYLFLFVILLKFNFSFNVDIVNIILSRFDNIEYNNKIILVFLRDKKCINIRFF